MRLQLFFYIKLLPSLIFAQSSAQDEVIFASSMDWLSSKLNYVYYDEIGQKWWKNTFYVNDQKVITIKHISAHKPNTANVKNKTYIIRSFRIQDINPYTLKISDIKQTKGRLVKGKMLELRTFGFQDLIHKKINNKPASSTSFLYLSFPEGINDSVNNLAEIVKEKFREAIVSSTRVYASHDVSDLSTIFSILTGQFRSSSGTEWTAQSVHPHLLKIEIKESNHILYFGFDTNKNQYYLVELAPGGFTSTFLESAAGLELALKQEDEKIFSFPTLNSFVFKGETYFRQ